MNEWIEEYINTLPHIVKVSKKKYAFIYDYSPTLESFREYVINVKKGKLKKKYYPMLDTLRITYEKGEVSEAEQAKIMLYVAGRQNFYQFFLVNNSLNIS